MGLSVRLNINMPKTERELAFMRDLDINESWTKRFTDLIDKHVGFKEAKNILYINAGTGDHCIAIREKTGDKTAMFATCENDELLKIARDKSAAVRSDVDFSQIEFEDDSFDAVVADASFTRPTAVIGLLFDAVRVTRPGGRTAVVLPSAGSFGEIFSLLWEVFFNEDIGGQGNIAETMISDIPSLSHLEEKAEAAGLVEVKTETVNEAFDFENGSEFIKAPLVSDFLMPVWLETLAEDEKERVAAQLAQLIDAEDAGLSFRFSVKVTLLTGRKA
jgi:ubiquinone/menaquinone biosynthesis C-methylase UbiE